MGFQSSFNQALGTLAGAFLGAKHIKGQKESLAEQKMQGKFNVEREVEREKGSNRAALDNIEQMGAEYDRSLDAMANQNAINDFMAARAGQALANETISKKNTFEAVSHRKDWIEHYMNWYGVGMHQANQKYMETHGMITKKKKKEVRNNGRTKRNA